MKALFIRTTINFLILTVADSQFMTSVQNDRNIEWPLYSTPDQMYMQCKITCLAIFSTNSLDFLTEVSLNAAETVLGENLNVEKIPTIEACTEKAKGLQRYEKCCEMPGKGMERV